MCAAAMERSYFVLVVRDADPGVLIPVFDEAVSKIFRVVQNGIPEGPKIIKGMVKIVVGHFGVAKRSIIGQGPSFFQLYLFGFAEGGVQQVDLAAALQMGEAEVEDLFHRGEVFEGGGKDDIVEAPVFEQARADIAVDEPEIGVVAEDPGGLLQFGEIDVSADDPGAGDLG